MRLDQIDDLIDRIQIHRPFFLDKKGTAEKQALKKEWYKVLVNYDYVDVNKNLDEFLKEPNNYRASPTVYELVAHIRKISDKKIVGNDQIYCSICNKIIEIKQWDKHFDRCLSIDYLSRLAQQYSKIKLDKGILWKMSDRDFEIYYWKCCEIIALKMPESFQKHNLNNAIRTHSGKEPEYNSKYLIGTLFHTLENEDKEEYNVL